MAASRGLDIGWLKSDCGVSTDTDTASLKEKKICIVIPKEKFTNPVVSFFEQYFREYSFTYIVYGPEDAQGYVRPQIGDLLEFDTWIAALACDRVGHVLKESNLIIIEYVIPLLTFRLLRYSKKLLLVFWGGDLYPYCADHLLSVRDCFKKILIQYAISKSAYVGTLTLDDGKLLNNSFPRHGKCYEVMVVGGDVGSEAISTIDCHSKNDGSLRILIGNSATETNRHIQILNQLAKFKDEDIELYLPLSYGDMEYREMVLSYGYKIFKDKFKPLVDFIAYSDYQALLRTIDVGVFNNSRQQGLGNISRLLRFGAKVYLPKDSPNYNHFSHLGCVIHDFHDINGEIFESFASYLDSERCQNMISTSTSRYRDRAIELWSNLFNEVIW